MQLNSNWENNIFYKFPVFLFSLLPIFLITGPFLSDLSISIISLIFIFYCLKKKNFSFFNNKYFFFFLAFYFYLVLNSLFNNFNFDSLKISVFFFRYGVFVIAILALLEFDSKFVKLFFYSIIIAFIILILDSFYEYIVGRNIFGWKNNYGLPDRLSSFFGEELILGSYLTRLLPLFFGLAILLAQNKIKFLFIPIFIFAEVTIFLTGERSDFFFLNLSAIFIILFSTNLKRLRLIILIISLIVLAIITFFNPSAKERIVDQTLTDMNFNLEKNEKNENKKLLIFSDTHTQLYTTAYRMFLDNKAAGVGVKNFRNFCNDEKYKAGNLSCSNHPHNYYLQIFSELGVIGIFFVLVTLFYFTKNLVKHIIARLKKENYFNDVEICLISGLLIFIWPIIPTGNVFNNWLIIITILYLPFLIWIRKSNNK